MAELRTSSYTIYVDLPGDDTKVLLVHGYSGAYDLVGRNLADYLRSREPRRAPKPLFGEWLEAAGPAREVATPGDGAMGSLVRRGYLTEMSVDEEHTYFQGVAAKIHLAAANRLSWVFMPNYDCNLRCFYCFQDHMRTDPAFSHLLRRMDTGLVDRIVSAIKGLEERHEVAPDTPRNLGFFGGEPLLAGNRGVIEYVLNSTDDRPRTVWAISNGTELGAYTDLLGTDGISTIQITLDGPPEEHDRRRIHPDGSGSFAQIADNITMALELGVTIQVRMNIDRTNIGQLPRLAEELHARNWVEHPNFMAYTYPVHAANDKTSRQSVFSPWELDLALDEMRIADPRLKFIDRPDDRMRRTAAQVLSKGVAPPLKAEFCGAHAGMYIFDALGDIYACWERTGDERVRIGRVSATGEAVMNTPVATLWRSRSVATVDACSKCRYALQCGGGCAVLAESKQGHINANHCDGFANRFRAMVGEAFVAIQAGEIEEPVAELVGEI